MRLSRTLRLWVKYPAMGWESRRRSRNLAMPSVAITRKGSQNVEHLLWPLTVDPVVRPLPVGAFGEASFDVTGTWLAFSTHIPDSEGGVLSMGKPMSLVPLASDVTSFAWHDGTSGALAYTQELDGLWVLSVSSNHT